MKKLLAAFILGVFVLAGGVWAQNIVTYAVTPVDSRAEVGTTFDVDIILTTNVGLTKATVVMTYDHTRIAYVTATNPTLPGNAVATNFPVPATVNSYVVGSFSPFFQEIHAAGYNGSIATVTFQVLPGVAVGATSPISLSVNEINEYGPVQNGTLLFITPTTLTNGLLTVVKRFNAADATLTVAEDSGFTPVNLAGKFTDQLGNPVAGTVTGITQPANGTAQLVGGVVSYRPNPDYFGPDSFTYTATDGVNAPDDGTINITVTPVNDAPVADSLVIYQGTPGTGTPVAETDLQEDGQYYVVVSASDIDNPANELTATITYRGQTLAPVTRDETGPNSATFTAVLPVDYAAVAHPNRTANYQLLATVSDGALGTGISVMTTIHDVDRPPVGDLDVTLPVTAFTNQNVTAIPTVGAVDPDGDAITVVYDWNLLSRAGGSFADSATLSSAATIKGDVWQVTARLRTNPYGDGAIVHDAPEATAEVTILNSDPVLGKLAHKMFIQKPDPIVPPVAKAWNLAAAQPTDADGDPLQYVITSLPDPARGTLSYEGGIPVRGTSIDSVPYLLPAGVSTVLYTVTDPETEFYDGNAGPQADKFEYAVTDGDGGDLGGVPSEPEEFRGVSLQTAVVKVEYRENQPPEIVGTPAPVVALPMDEVIDAAGTPNSQTFSIGFTDDEDPSGNGEMDRIDWYVSADNGATWSLQGQGASTRAALSGSFVFQTTYDTIFNGIDGVADQRPASKVFQVKAVGIDTQGGETEHIWEVTVNDIDRLPTAPTVAITPKPAFTDDDLLATVTGASTDPDGDPIVDYDFAWQQTARLVLYTDTLTADNTAKHETWQVSARAVTNPYGSANGSLERNYIGYSLGPAGTDSVTISNSPPVATDDATTTDEDNFIDIPVVLGNAPTRVLGVNPDTDADGDNLTVKSVQGLPAGKGLLSIRPGGKEIRFNPNGKFEYLAPGDSEEVSFSYTVTDGDGIAEGTDTATVTVTVTGVNDQALAQNLTVTTEIDTATAPFEVTVTDVDDGQTHEFILHDTAPPAGGAPTLLAPANGTVVFAGSRGSVGTALLVYTPNLGFTGVDSFQFAAWDGYEYSTVGTVTVVVGTPLWYPFFDLADLLDARPGLDANKWYHVVIRKQGGQAVVDTAIFGTEMDPIDYFRAGSEGLLPGAYTVHFETWNPANNTYGGQGWSGQIVVNDYGYAETPEDLAVLSPARIVGTAPGIYTFQFRAINARGYILEVERNGQLYRRYRNVFLPDEEGRLAPTQDVELEVKLNEAGSYTTRVRGFNPLDEQAEGGVRADTPGPRWAGFQAFVIATDTGSEEPGDVAEGIFPNGHVFVAASGSITITMQWKPVAGAVSYALYLGAGNAAPMFNGENVGNLTSWRVTLPLGSYIWQVVAINAAGNGMWSVPYVFDVVRDSSAPIIRTVNLDGGTALRLSYAEESVAATRVDIQHYQTAGVAGWKVYANVAVAAVGQGGRLVVPTANFRVGDYLLIKAYAASGKSTDYRVLVIGGPLGVVE